jgi:hypothetical protein
MTREEVIMTVAKEIIVAAAFECERMAKLNVGSMDAVDTGALRASIYTRTKKSGGRFSPGMITSLRKITKKGASMTGKRFIELPAPQGDEIAVVGPSVEYGYYVEFGLGSNRKRGSRPFLGRATEAIARKINNGSMFKRLFG